MRRALEASVPSPLTLATGATSVELYRGGADEWDGFVRRAPRGTFFHLLGWRDVLAETFGFRPRYLAARRAGQLVGVLPLCEVRSPLRRPQLLSLPFTVEGGVCALDSEAQGALEAAAIELAVDVGADVVELRDGLDGSGFTVRDGVYFRFQRPVFATDEENLASLRRKQRRMVRIGQRSGLTVAIDTDDIGVFYDLFARSMRRLGTPVFPKRYFRALCRVFGADCVVLTVRHAGTPVAACLSFFFGDRVLPYYAGSRREFVRYAVNDYMYWELMRYARTRAVRVFDFGRSRRGSGACAFKRHWGCEPEPMRYRVRCATPPSAGGRTGDAAVALLRIAWQRAPLVLTRVLGPALVRHFGVYYT